jgi:SAM-dependent methyltransferase
MYSETTECRLCTRADLDVLLELGNQYLTGVFPRARVDALTRGPLTLVRCACCGLVQLGHSYDRSELYGSTYGYRSSLNAMMVDHLREIARRLARMVCLTAGDLVVDIGSNDGTLLSCFSEHGADLVGVDPSAARWQDRYPAGSTLVPDFFSADAVRTVAGERKVKIVTSIAMFYDLERPLDVTEEIASLLADDGVWLLEQSYLPAMLRTNGYDTICHEHLEYYAMAQIKWLADRVGLRILDVDVNDVNGGSFAVMLGRRRPDRAAAARVNELLAREASMGCGSVATFQEFAARVLAHRSELVEMLESIRARGETVLGYGASTKGNVLLQFAGIDPSLLPAIAEVNADKFGCVTPGTWIPIISEADAHARKPAYFLVLPWHFRSGIVQRESRYLADGGRLIFPLPHVEVVKV